MATATYVRGEKSPIDYTSAATIAVDTVVVCGAAGNVSVGVATQAMVSGDELPVDVEGIFEFPKTTGAVIKAGESVNWDASAGSVDDNAATAATGDVSDFGVAQEDAGSGVLVINVKLKPGNGAIT